MNSKFQVNPKVKFSKKIIVSRKLKKENHLRKV